MLWIWSARVAWTLLPITLGGALTDALEAWSSPPTVVAVAACWIVWAAGLVVLFSPRPWGLTLLRIAAPVALAIATATIPSVTAGVAALAVGGALAACVLALGQPITSAAANGVAYGDERRFPLRVPPPLLLIPLPVAVASIAGGVIGGPLLLADGRIASGVGTAVVGLPIAGLLIRSMHALSRRWVVLVPAGLVVVDPLTLTDPVLVLREHIASVRPTSVQAPPAGVLDLRLGACVGSIAMTLREPTAFVRRRGRTGGEVTEPGAVLVSVLRARSLVEAAKQRRIATIQG